MNNSEYLKYSATEPMTELRRRFNDGESIYKDVPVELSIDNARADVLYVQYVFENAYSGYSYYDETLFRTAFISVLDELESLERITPNELIDLMCKHLQLTSLKFQRLDDLVEAIGLPKECLCTHCWDNSSYDE